MVSKQLLYYPTVTREPFRNTGRITELMASGKLYRDLGLPDLDAAAGPGDDTAAARRSCRMRAVHLLERGFVEGNHGEPGQFVVEKAFVEAIASGRQMR